MTVVVNRWRSRRFSAAAFSFCSAPFLSKGYLAAAAYKTMSRVWWMHRSSNWKACSVWMILASVGFGLTSRINTVVLIPQPVSSGACFAGVMIFRCLGEEKQRLRVFRDHLQYVLQSNLQKLRTFQLEMNEFSDWTIEEFNALKKGLITSTSLRRQLSQRVEHDEDSVRRSLQKLYQDHYRLRRVRRNAFHRRRNEDSKRGFTDWLWNLISSNSSSGGNGNNNGGQSSSSFDWRSKNVIGSIKNQLNCGCCYAFATASVLESAYAIKTNAKSVTELSPQQLTDCSANGNNGCNGGNFAPSVRYVLGQGNKIATLASYPYAGRKQTCQTSGINQINLGNIQYGAIPEGNEKAMAESLVSNGPIFIGLDADSKLFMFYKTGVLSISNCPTRRQDMDHAMVAVGYGYDNVLKSSYWIVKNSWGEKWGENGYLRLAKDAGNMCGITSMAYFAKLTWRKTSFHSHACSQLLFSLSLSLSTNNNETFWIVRGRITPVNMYECVEQQAKRSIVCTWIVLKERKKEWMNEWKRENCLNRTTKTDRYGWWRPMPSGITMILVGSDLSGYSDLCNRVNTKSSLEIVIQADLRIRCHYHRLVMSCYCFHRAVVGRRCGESIRSGQGYSPIAPMPFVDHWKSNTHNRSRQCFSR